MRPAVFGKAAGLIVLSVLLATCGEDGASGPSISPVLGRVEFTPSYSSGGQFLGANLPIDRVRVLVVRPPSTTLKDTTRSFDANLDQIRLDIPILLRATAESLDVTLELLSGTQVIFRGTSRLEARSGPPSDTPPPPLPLTFVGPGSQLAQLVMAPLDSMLSQGDSLTMRLTGLDASQAPVPAFYVSWSSSDTTVAKVNGAGVVRGRVPRGTIYVRARTPATVTFPQGIVESTTVTLAAAPTGITIFAGDNQTAPVGTRLPLMLAVEVKASDNLPVPGVAVAFAPEIGGGTVDSATATTDASGIARTGAVLGLTVGNQTFTATLAGVGVVTFNATATATPSPIWTGAVSTDWNNAANWNTGVVPGSADSVTVPAGPANQPVLSSGNATVGALLLDGTLSLGGLSITAFGNVRGAGSIVGGGATGALVMPLAGTVLDLATLPNVFISASVTLGRTVNITGQLNIGGSGNLTFANHTANVSSDFSTSGTAIITMTSPLDSLRVLGDILFAGGSTAGAITTGVIFIRGDFSQSSVSSPRSYAPSGNHIDVFNGTGVQTVTFATPGASGSNFETLVLANIAGGITLASDIFQAGPVGFATGVPRIVHGSGQTVFVAELLASRVTLDNVLIVSNNVAITQFDSVTFQNYAPTATPLTISHPGAAASFVFNDLVFQVVPTSGFYISVTDNAADANVLTIDMVNPTPGTPGGFVQTAGGAVVNWPAVPAGVRTWNGTVSNNWSVAGNWTPALVPTSADDVVIPGGTPTNPVVTSSCSAKSILVNSGGSLNLGSFNCQVQGNVFVGGTTAGTGAFQLQAPGQVSGNLRGLIVNAPVSLNSIAAIIGDLTISGVGASFNMNGHSAVVTGDLSVQGAALLIMTNAGDNLSVQGGATFDGASELNSLTAGDLNLVGDFTQAATNSANSFLATGTHSTQFNGSGTQTIIFASPGPSAFQEFGYLGLGQLDLASDVVVRGTFFSLVSSLITGNGNDLSATGVSVTGTTFDDVRVLVVSNLATTPVSIDSSFFQNYPATATQLSINHPGSPAHFVLDQLTFSSTPTAGGFYISAQDMAPADGNVLTIDLTNPTPGTGSPFIQTISGAVVNWPAGPAPVIIWTGAVSTDWSNPANWNSNQVPTFADSVEIPAGGNQPSLSTTSFARAVHLANGTLTLNGQVLAVVTTFATSGSGRLVMTNPNDGLSIVGNAIFDGGNQLGFMTEGVISIVGNLSQLATNSPDSYHPSGAHITSFIGVNPTITFATPGLVPGSSHFQGVFWSGTGTLTLGSAVFAHGDWISATSAPTTIQGTGTLDVGGFFTSGQTLTFDGLALEINGTGASSFVLNNVSFVNQNPAGIQLTVRHPGESGSIATQNLTFTTVPTTGFYMLAEDVTPVDGQVLTIDMVNPNPATDGGFTQTAGGAVINWPAAGGGSATWTGVASNQDWNDPGNWAGGTVPNPSDDVLIPAAASSFPSIISSEQVDDLIVEAGALIDINDGNLEVTGDLTGGGIFTNAGPDMSGVGKIIQMADVASLTITGQVRAASNFLVSTGDLNITGPGAQFDVNGFTIDVSFGMSVVSGGLLIMTSPTGSLQVGGNAFFDGADETGFLTAGILSVAGTFTQANTTSPSSFMANGTHKTLLGASGARVINFATPGSGAGGSHFQDVDVTAATGGLTLFSNIVADGALISHPGGIASPPTITGGGKTVTVVSLNVDSLTLDNAPLVVNEQGTIRSQQFDNVTFQGFPTGATSTILLNITAVGTSLSPRLITFKTPIVQTSLGSGGLYAKLTSSNGLSVTLTIQSSNDPTGGPSRSDPPFGTTVNGARIVWQ